MMGNKREQSQQIVGSNGAPGLECPCRKTGQPYSPQATFVMLMTQSLGALEAPSQISESSFTGALELRL